MEILCSSCRKRIAIPDEKIPQASTFTFICPYCRERVTVEKKAPAFSAEETALKHAVPDADSEGMQVDLDSFPPGVRSVFVYIRDARWKGLVEDFFRQREYYCVIPEAVTQARGKLRLQHHDVVVIEDSTETASLITEVNHWRGLQRRESNVVLLGSDSPSLGPDEAFIRGVNTYLNREDLERAGELLGACLEGYELSFSPWVKAKEMESGVS